MQKIHVTQEHIDRGRVGNASVCPIALAIYEQTKYQNVAVHPKRILVLSSNWMTSAKTVGGIRLPRAATKFIHAFDARLKVEPFNFILNPVESYLNED